MSYILDALKKSEQQRGHDSAPGIQTMHSSGLNYYSSKNSMWPYLLIGAIAINLAALFYYMATDSDEGPAQTVAQATPAQPAMIQPVRAIKTTPKPVVDTRQPEPVAVYQQMPASRLEPVQTMNREQAISNATASLLERDELPFEVKQHIPMMEFSAHVYSSNPLHRSIIINGRLLEEGDHFASDLRLSEITPDGAIFDFQGHMFHQGVITSWN